LFCLGLHGEVSIGQKHRRTLAPSHERIVAISVMSASNEDRSLGRGQERDREDAGDRVHQAVQVCRVNF
jgi:hypothetical protein